MKKGRHFEKLLPKDKGVASPIKKPAFRSILNKVDC